MGSKKEKVIELFAWINFALADFGPVGPKHYSNSIFERIQNG